MRFTVRRMMIAVAVVALLLGAYGMMGVSLYHRKQARMFALAEAYCLRELANHERIIASLVGQAGATARGREAQHTALQAQTGRRAAHFSTMRSKHERAARYPWLPVAPDPSEPK